MMFITWEYLPFSYGVYAGVLAPCPGWLCASWWITWEFAYMDALLTMKRLGGGG